MPFKLRVAGGALLGLTILILILAFVYFCMTVHRRLSIWTHRNTMPQQSTLRDYASLR